MKQLIKDVLEDIADSQPNLHSETARENIANLIVATIRSKGKGWYLNLNHTKEQEEEDKKLLESHKTEEWKVRDSWVCSICGKNTYDVDWDYIGTGTNHLGCDLELEMKSRGVIKPKKRVKKKFYEDMGDGHMIEVGKLAEEIVDSQEGKWIYESPDGGKTVFRRPFSNYDPKYKEEIDFKTKEPTGRMFTDWPFRDKTDVQIDGC